MVYTWLMTYIHSNTELRENAKNGLEKRFSMLMNKSIFGKTMGNVQEKRYRKRNYLVSEANFTQQNGFLKSY